MFLRRAQLPRKHVFRRRTGEAGKAAAPSKHEEEKRSVVEEIQNEEMISRLCGDGFIFPTSLT
jgi:hypothetical protein